MSASVPQILLASKDPEKKDYNKEDRVTLRVRSVDGTGFNVWRINGHG